MGSVGEPEPARLIVGAISGFPEAWSTARMRLEALFGPIDIEAGPWRFDFTDYYGQEMGGGLSRWFVSFPRLISQEAVAGFKELTNGIEAELAAAGAWPVRRPVNLDPGYVTLGKLVLATTKDQAHRLAVGRGMYAEVTLRFSGKSFVPWEWTYPDYRQPGCLDFMGSVRERLRLALRGCGRGAGA
jgi:hypothetical protein